MKPSGIKSCDSYITLLRERVSSTPDKTAYVYRDRRYSWRDIDMASQIMAHDLSESGVKKGDRVGICSKNSINWIFAFYALQKLGAVAVLINHKLSPPEFSDLCENARVSFVCGRQYDISDEVDITARFDGYEKISRLFDEVYDPHSPGLILFTSGSTGKPKAVTESPCDCLDGVRFFETEFRLTDEDRNCAVLPFFHVFGLATGISLGLLGNYPSYIPSDSRPSTVLSLIEKYKCTVLETVPTVMLAMTELPDFSPDRARSLRVTVMGGSSASPSQMKKLCDILPHDRFANVYGMSEMIAVSVTRYDDSLGHMTSTVGAPLPGVEVEIRDTATGQRLDDGQTGVIFVRRRVTDDFLDTGDLGYIGQDGYIRLCGRVREVIIRGGENISPTEVADAVALLPSVADVRVFGVPHSLLGEEVAAAVILKPGMTFDPDSRKLLENRIAKYKIPAHFAVMDKFPLLGSGKVDMTALRQQIVSGNLK